MKLIRGIVAYCFAALLVSLMWRLFAAPFGGLAGFVAAIIAIGPAWYICHYRRLIPQSEAEIAIDMGGAIGTAAFVSSSLHYGLSQAIQALPTLICVLIGASLAGLAYSQLEKKRLK